MPLKVGAHVHIKSKVSACLRTKNRIREHGEQGFVVTQGPRRISLDKGAQAWAHLTSVSTLASDGKGGKEQWTGWLPVNEVEVEG
jgi:hypothetical protein